MGIRILLADEHRILREALSALLKSQADFQVVGEASDGHDALRQIRQARPDVVIADISLPLLNGMEITRHVSSELPGTHVLALSGHQDKRLVIEMLRCGASGCVPDSCSVDELIGAVRSVAKGKVYFNQEIGEILLSDYRTPPAATPSAPGSLLSVREREVLQAIAEGLTTKRIAALLHVSVKTVDTHRQHIMKKLEKHSVADLTKYAIREGLTRA